MALLIPPDASVGVQRALRDLDGRIDKVGGQAAGVSQSELQSAIDSLRKELSAGSGKSALNPNDTFRASGGAHSLGLVPDPGAWADDSQVLCEDGKWRYPYNGTLSKVRETTGDVEDTLCLNGNLVIAGRLSAHEVYSPTTNPVCVVYKSANQSINDSTWTSVTWDTIYTDTANMYTAATPGRLTCQVTGLYLLVTRVVWDPVVASTVRAARIVVNGVGTIGTISIANAPSATEPTGVEVISLQRLTTADWFYVQGYQSSGGALNALGAARYYTTFKALWIGP